MCADLLTVTHRLDQVIGQILRVGCHETDALQSLNLINLAEKLGKCHRLLQVLSVGVDVLSQQHDLHNAVCYQSLDLIDDILRLSAALPSAHVRHDAVAAEVVAAKHDVDTGLKGIFAVYRKLLHDLVGILPDIHDHAVFAHHAAAQQLRQLENIVGTKDQIDIRVALLDLLNDRRLLHHAATKRDHHARTFLF